VLRKRLTEISDTISDHDTLQIDLGLAMFLELEISIRNSRSKEWEVSTLRGSAEGPAGDYKLTP
jgi:hypothetical protein